MKKCPPALNVNIFNSLFSGFCRGGPATLTPQSGTCWVMGNLHYTFDGQYYTFMGNCSYTVAKNCHVSGNLPAFEVDTKNVNEGNTQVPSVGTVTVNVYGINIDIVRSELGIVRVSQPVVFRCYVDIVWILMKNTHLWQRWSFPCGVTHLLCTFQQIVGQNVFRKWSLIDWSITCRWTTNNGLSQSSWTTARWIFSRKAFWSSSRLISAWPCNTTGTSTSPSHCRAVLPAVCAACVAISTTKRKMISQLLAVQWPAAGQRWDRAGGFPVAQAMPIARTNVSASVKAVLSVKFRN